MSRRTLWIVLAFAVGALAGRAFLGSETTAWLGAAPAMAGDAAAVEDGQTFVTADGPSTYLWRRSGDRLELLGECTRTPEGKAQATFVLFAFTLFGDDVEADVDALVANVDGGTGDQLAHVPLALVAERALQPFAVAFLS